MNTVISYDFNQFTTQNIDALANLALGSYWYPDANADPTPVIATVSATKVLRSAVNDESLCQAWVGLPRWQIIATKPPSFTRTIVFQKSGTAGTTENAVIAVGAYGAGDAAGWVGIKIDYGGVATDKVSLRTIDYQTTIGTGVYDAAWATTHTLVFTYDNPTGNITVTLDGSEQATLEDPSHTLTWTSSTARASVVFVSNSTVPCINILSDTITTADHVPVTYYIRTTGNDTETGTDLAHALASPYPLRVGAATVAAYGDIIDVGTGSFTTGGTGTFGLPDGVSIVGPGSGAATITTTKASPNTWKCDNISITGITILLNGTLGVSQSFGNVQSTIPVTLTLTDVVMSSNTMAITLASATVPRTLNMSSSFITGTNYAIYADHASWQYTIVNSTNSTFLALNPNLTSNTLATGLYIQTGTFRINGGTIGAINLLENGSASALYAADFSGITVNGTTLLSNASGSGAARDVDHPAATGYAPTLTLTGYFNPSKIYNASSEMVITQTQTAYARADSITLVRNGSNAVLNSICAIATSGKWVIDGGSANMFSGGTITGTLTGYASANTNVAVTFYDNGGTLTANILAYQTVSYAHPTITISTPNPASLVYTGTTSFTATFSETGGTLTPTCNLAGTFSPTASESTTQLFTFSSAATGSATFTVTGTLSDYTMTSTASATVTSPTLTISALSRPEFPFNGTTSFTATLGATGGTLTPTSTLAGTFAPTASTTTPQLFTFTAAATGSTTFTVSATMANFTTTATASGIIDIATLSISSVTLAITDLGQTTNRYRVNGGAVWATGATATTIVLTERTTSIVYEALGGTGAILGRGAVIWTVDSTFPIVVNLLQS